MLVSLRSPFGQVEALVDRLPFVMGRGSDCDLRSESRMVSRRHCELLADESGVMVRDLGSLHGTYVNGERVDGQRRLENGNVLGLGPIPYQIIITDSMRRTIIERLRRALPSGRARPRHPR